MVEIVFTLSQKQTVWPPIKPRGNVERITHVLDTRLDSCAENRRVETTPTLNLNCIESRKYLDTVIS